MTDLRCRRPSLARAAAVVVCGALAACSGPRHARPPAAAPSRPASVGAASSAASGVTPTPPPTPAPAVPSATGPARGAAFASVDGAPITGDDVARAFFRMYRSEARMVLTRLVVAEIVRREAARAGIVPPEEAIAAEREKAFARLADEATIAYGKDADVARFLKNEMQLTPAEWARRTEEELRERWLRDRVLRYQAMKSERVEIQLLAVRDEALARELASKLDQGADFAALAAAHSVHESAAQGGRLPPVAREALNETLAEKAFALEPGGRTGVLSVDDGKGGRQYDVVKLLRRLPARDEPWPAVAAEIEAGLAKEPVSAFERVAWQLAAFRLYNVTSDDSL